MLRTVVTGAGAGAANTSHDAHVPSAQVIVLTEYVDPDLELYATIGIPSRGWPEGGTMTEAYVALAALSTRLVPVLHVGERQSTTPRAPSVKSERERVSVCDVVCVMQYRD